MMLPPVVLQFVPFVAGALVVLALVVTLIVLRRRGAKRHAEALLREERALQALSLLRDSRLVPPTMEQAVEVFDVDALLRENAAPAAEAPRPAPEAPKPAPAPPARVPAPPAAQAAAPPVFGEDDDGPDTFGGLDVSTSEPLPVPEVRELPDGDTGMAPPAAAGAPPAGARGLGADVPLRDLALVWFEARGYQASAASRAVLPIEYVLRHRGDPARAYAFVALAESLTEQKGSELIERAHGIGLERLLVTTERGTERAVKRAMRRRGLRLMDREAMDETLAKLDFRVAAKIVAIAGGRSEAARSGG